MRSEVPPQDLCIVLRGDNFSNSGTVYPVHAVLSIFNQLINWVASVRPDIPKSPTEQGVGCNKDFFLLFSWICVSSISTSGKTRRPSCFFQRILSPNSDDSLPSLLLAFRSFDALGIPWRFSDVVEMGRMDYPSPGLKFLTRCTILRLHCEMTWVNPQPYFINLGLLRDRPAGATEINNCVGKLLTAIVHFGL